MVYQVSATRDNRSQREGIQKSEQPHSTNEIGEVPSERPEGGKGDCQLIWFN